MYCEVVLQSTVGINTEATMALLLSLFDPMQWLRSQMEEQKMGMEQRKNRVVEEKIEEDKEKREQERTK